MTGTDPVTSREAEMQADASLPGQDRAAIGMFLPGMIVGVLGVIMIWRMFGKEDGYDWGGFELSVFLRGLGMLTAAGLFGLAGWGVAKARRWAAALGLVLCGVALAFGVVAGLEWAFGGPGASGEGVDSKVQLGMAIAILTVGSVVEAWWLIRCLLAPAFSRVG